VTIITSIENLGYMLKYISALYWSIPSLDNVSKMIKFRFGKDEWNYWGSLSLQVEKIGESLFAFNYSYEILITIGNSKMLINLVWILSAGLCNRNPRFRKSFGVINPFNPSDDRQVSPCAVYDFKFPDGAIALFPLSQSSDKKKKPNSKFHVINLDEVEYSRKRINPPIGIPEKNGRQCLLKTRLRPYQVLSKNQIHREAQTSFRTYQQSTFFRLYLFGCPV